MTDLETRPYQAHTNGNGHRNGAIGPIDEARRRAQRPRLPPHNLDAEQSLLGAMLLSRDAIAAAAETCRAEDFYKPAHAHVFDAIVNLYGQGEPADPVTVAGELGRAGLLDVAGGLPAITSLSVETPATTNAPRYASVIREASLLRRLIGAAGEIAEMGYSYGDVPTILDQAEQMLFDITDHASPAGHAEPLVTAIRPWLDHLDDRCQNGSGGIPTGLADLDEKLGGGLRPGQLCTVGGRPGSGKSILGVQMGFDIAETLNKPSLVVSAEMPTEEMVERTISARAKVDNQRLRTGRLLETDWQKISGAVARCSQVPLYVYDAPGATLASIRSEVRRVSAASGSHPTVIVDYLQLLTTSSRTENRQVEVDTLARGLKVLARDLNVPVVTLCQLNRNLETRADKRPVLGDLRESGGVENHSDCVIGVYRDEMYHPQSKDRGTAELIVLKQRGGPTGTVRVSYLSHFGTFANMARISGGVG